MTREAVKRMRVKKVKGHIITVSSVSGLYGAPSYSAYCASKHGVTGFMRSIKWELRKEAIKVSTIYPARVDTELFDDYENRPHRWELLPARDIANYLVAIASKSLPRIIAVRVTLILKRMYCFAKYVIR